MKIIHAPHQILATKCRSVTAFDQSLVTIVKDMSHTLEIQHEPDCVGLAANQVGIDLAFFIMRPDPDDEISVHINPKIKKTLTTKKTKAGKKRIKYEGCMSLPHIWGEMTRNEKILLVFQDLKGDVHEKWYSGFAAQIVQHEIDHLQGILFTQRVLEQGGTLFEEKDDKLEPISFR